MSHERREHFRCDRCGKKTESRDGQQPQEWRRVMVTRPLLANPLEVVHACRKDMHLCDVCGRELTRWLENLAALGAAS